LVDLTMGSGIKMRALRKFGLALAIFALLAGCRHAPVSYQLVRQDSTAILIPPTQVASGASSSQHDISIKRSRAKELSRTGCDIEDSLLALHWSGNTTDVRLKLETYYPGPADQATLKGVPQPGMYLSSLEDLDAARRDLLNLEAKGCLTSIEDQHLLHAIVERLPLPPDVAYLLRYGSYGISGGIDLNSDFRLQVISPVYSDSADPPAGSIATAAPEKHVIGYEYAYYDLNSSERDGRVKISLASVTENDQGSKIPIPKSTTQNPSPFPDSSGFFRLLFRRAASSSDHVVTIIGAPDQATLDQATKQRESGPVESCQGVSGAGVTCVTFSSHFGVNPQMRVLVNGKENFVGISGTVRDALNLNRPDATAPKNLIVRRLFEGRLIPVKYDPASNDILRLVLMPGDEISW
jgi:hypothetical protein